MPTGRFISTTRCAHPEARPCTDAGKDESLDMLRDEAALPWLHLHRLSGAAPLRHLLEHFGGVEAIYGAPRAELLPFFGADPAPVDILLVGPDAGQFENERRWLQGVVLTLAPHVTHCLYPQFRVNQRQQIVTRLPVALTPCAQKIADRTGVVYHGGVELVIEPCAPRVNRPPPGRRDDADLPRFTR